MDCDHLYYEYERIYKEREPKIASMEGEIARLQKELRGPGLDDEQKEFSSRGFSL